jgi:cytochrome P450
MTAATLPLPPGSRGLPLVGETFEFVKDPYAFIEARFRRHGSIFRTRLFGEDVACFVGPDALATFFDEGRFSRDQASPAGIRRLLSPDAVPFLDGAAHRTRKRLLLAAVGAAALPDYLETVHAATVARIERWVSRGGEVRWVDEIADHAFALTAALLAGGDAARPDPELRADFDRFNAGVFSAPIDLPFTTYGKALRARARLVSRLGETVRACRAAPRKDVMSALVRAEVEGARLSDAEIVTETLHLFFAAYAGLWGHMACLAHALSEHAEVRERARAEALALPPGPPAPEVIARRDTLDRVYREVKRFYPAIPTTFFAKARADVEALGFRVPAGWKAFGCVYATLHDERSFRDPDRFDPDRFGEGRAEDAREHAFIPQGGGPLEGHRCAGEAFAGAVVKTFAIEVLRRCEWSVPAQDLSIDRSVMPPVPRDGLRATLRARAS